MVKPEPDAARLHAWEVYRSVSQGLEFSHIVLPASLANSDFDGRDRAFITELVYGALRAQGQSDYLLTLVSERALEDIDTKLLEVLRFTIYQIFHMRIPPHAAVSANMELAKLVVGESKASFLNAIARKLTTRTLDDWLQNADSIEDPVDRLSKIYSHPQWIISAYFDLLKDEESVVAELMSNNRPSKPTLIAWPGLSHPGELEGERTSYSPYGVVASKPPHHYHQIRERLAGVQDEGSQLVALNFFNALQAPKSVLDICAGPGGKAALLSALCKREGAAFTANEISPARTELVKQVVRYGRVSNLDARAVTGEFDAVIADVPCTGIGALRRRPEVRWRRDISALKEILPLQRDIAQRSVDLLTPGGVFGYSTCSPHLAETRGVINWLLAKNPELEEIEVPFPENLEQARSGKAMQLWGFRHNTDAMFLALLRKRDTV